jgi:ethanolaminephosphotransferase
MTPKHMEMDAVIQEIYTAMMNKQELNSTLLVLAGDHGMTDGGNHGGSGPGETSAALVFISPRLRSLTKSKGTKCPVTPRNDFEFYTKVEQSDIAPTLSGLLGLPIPLNNLGVFMPEFLPLFKTRKPTNLAMLSFC